MRDARCPVALRRENLGDSIPHPNLKSGDAHLPDTMFHMVLPPRAAPRDVFSFAGATLVVSLLAYSFFFFFLPTTNAAV